jgi:hypothetical protein
MTGVIEDVNTHYLLFLELGFEGIVFRDLDELYGFDERSMFRIKPTYQEWFEVKSVSDKPRSPGCAIFNFGGWSATINYPKQTQQHFFKHPEKIVGQKVLVEYRGTTSAGIPRNAKVINIPL